MADELPEEQGRAKLPPELARIRQHDFEAHVEAGKRAGLSEAQAVAHAGSHMEERTEEEYRSPSDHHFGGAKATDWKRRVDEGEVPEAFEEVGAEERRSFVRDEDTRPGFRARLFGYRGGP